jgi:hypothetical protein
MWYKIPLISGVITAESKLQNEKLTKQPAGIFLVCCSYNCYLVMYLIRRFLLQTGRNYVQLSTKHGILEKVTTKYMQNTYEGLEKVKENLIKMRYSQ